MHLMQLSRRTSFWLIASTFGLLTAGGTLPTPLYTLWGEELRFDTLVTTWIFAVYVAGVLIALVFVGELSDQVGRRPLAITALVAAICSTTVFIVGGSIVALMVARFLSGLSVGLITAPATAALAELYPGRSKATPALVATAVNMGGLGLGPLLSGLFAEYFPMPTTLVFLVFLVLLGVALFLTPFVPETRVPQDAPIDWAPRVGVPARSRHVFWRLAIMIFPTFTILGLFTSLTPRFIREQLSLDNLLIAGAATFLLFLAGVIGQIVWHDVDKRLAIVWGLTLLLIALALVAAGTLLPSAVTFGAGAMVGGLGAGLGFMGGLGQIAELVSDDKRAAATSAYFIAAQSGVALPVLAIGILSVALGLTAATLVVMAATAVLASVALMITVRSR